MVNFLKTLVDAFCGVHFEVNQFHPRPVKLFALYDLKVMSGH